MRNLLLLIPLCLFFTIDSLAQKKNKTEVNYLDKISLNGLKWRSVGPALTSGRVSDIAVNPRSEERRVGKECRSRWSPYH